MDPQAPFRVPSPVVIVIPIGPLLLSLLTAAIRLVPTVLSPLLCLGPARSNRCRILPTVVSAPLLTKADSAGLALGLGLPISLTFNLPTRLSRVRTRLRIILQLKLTVLTTLVLGSRPVLVLITTMLLGEFVIIKLKLLPLILPQAGPTIKLLFIRFMCIVVTGLPKGTPVNSIVIEVFAVVSILGGIRLLTVRAAVITRTLLCS